MGRLRIAVDSSALVAIAIGEPDRDQLVQCIDASDEPLCSVVTLFETGTVLLNRKHFRTAGEIELFFRTLRLQEQPFTVIQMRIAMEAYARHGKGMGKRPFLNLGDCVSYALAKSLGVPLLYKGEDFGVTDIEPVLRTKKGEN
jgi:ribonuclease VapC